MDRVRTLEARLNCLSASSIIASSALLDWIPQNRHSALKGNYRRFARSVLDRNPEPGHGM